MTEAATRFVTPLTFQSLTGRPVYTTMWGALDAAMGEVEQLVEVLAGAGDPQVIRFDGHGSSARRIEGPQSGEAPARGLRSPEIQTPPAERLSSEYWPTWSPR